MLLPSCPTEKGRRRNRRSLHLWKNVQDSEIWLSSLDVTFLGGWWMEALTSEYSYILTYFIFPGKMRLFFGWIKTRVERVFFTIVALTTKTQRGILPAFYSVLFLFSFGGKRGFSFLSKKNPIESFLIRSRSEKRGFLLHILVVKKGEIWNSPIPEIKI